MSKSLTGQLLRLGGLIIEMLGVWAVFQGNGDKNPPSLRIPGTAPLPLAWLGVGVGFVLWLAGTALVYAARPSRKVRSSGTGDTDLP
jgi:hypothetical protein